MPTGPFNHSYRKAADVFNFTWILRSVVWHLTRSPAIGHPRHAALDEVVTINTDLAL